MWTHLPKGNAKQEKKCFFLQEEANQKYLDRVLTVAEGLGTAKKCTKIKRLFLLKHSKAI